MLIIDTNRLRSGVSAGKVDWKVAILFLVAGVLLRDQIVGFFGGGAPAATPVAAAVAPGDAPRRFRPPPVADVPAWSAGPAEPLPPPLSAEPAAAPPPPLPVVITPTLEYSHNVAVARRERGGHFTFETEVNGVSVPMAFDTGASYVTLRAADAARVGLDVGSLTYSLIGRTANGTAEFAPVTIATLTVGTITRRNVAALVARPGKLDINLLGQSFLTRVASVNVEGNQVVLRGGEMREGR